MKYVFSLLIILLLSCAPETDCCSNFDVGMQLGVFDSNGFDRLNPGNVNAFTSQNIKIYYVIDGVTEYQSSGEGDVFKVFKSENHENYTISLGVYIKENPSTTLIKWNETDIDTIKCEVLRTSNNTRITKVWYNNELKWDGVNERYFEIVK